MSRKKYDTTIDNDIAFNNIIEIEDIMEKTNSFNLRSFIFGCQKTIDIFEQIDEELDDDFCKSIFYSNIAFCLKT